MTTASGREESKTTRLVTLAERRRRLVEEYGYVVKRVADQMTRRIRHAGNVLDADDLYSVGVIGLFEAEQRFDPDAGTPFETFAEFRIKGAMLDELRRRDFMPRRLRVKANRVEAAERRLRRELGRAPSVDEMAQALEMSSDAFVELRAKVRAYRFVPVEKVFDLRCHRPGPHEFTLRREQVEILVESIEKLSEREQLILDLYFVREITLREIGEVLGVTEGRISQIKTAAIAKLREMIVGRVDVRSAA